MSDFNTNTDNHDEWLTPLYIINSLGKFDLDPCAPIPEKRPWSTADKHYSILDDGLWPEWEGRVWCNPPYGEHTYTWLEKLADHGNGIALIFARTETKLFHREVWGRADAIFFFEGRLRFYRINGEEADSANAPSCLIAYGLNNIQAIENSKLKGKLILLTHKE